jgi:hypothetical protein
MAITATVLILLNDVYYDYYWLIHKKEDALESVDHYVRIFCNLINMFILIYLFVANKKTFETSPKEKQLSIMGGIGLKTATEFDIQ